jgi:ParB-like chromosome segregation protein Spo0J
MKYEIEEVNPQSLSVPEWRATYILRPDLIVLSSSLSDFGFIQPIHVSARTGEIIDGSERFLLATNVKHIMEITNGKIPVVKHDIDTVQAMAMHLRLNRGRGSVVAKPMSSIIKKLIRSRAFTQEDLERVLCMKQNEYSLMIDGTILKSRNIKEYTYSRAWVPVEAPPGTLDSGPVIESPPNADR